MSPSPTASTPTSRAPRDGSEPRGLPDLDDPFGTRRDEKPPSGWDDRFWDDIRNRIEDSRGRPEHGKLPDPGRWRRLGARATGALVVLLIAAGFVAASRSGPGDGPRTTAFPPTVVRVDGSDLPDVEVDWARRDGRDAGVAVFRSVDPDVSYVYIDARLPARAARAIPGDGAVAHATISSGEPEAIVRADRPSEAAALAGIGLVRMFRGRVLPSTQEVEVTTFFRDPGFFQLAGPDAAPQDGLEEEVGAHARGVFSLGEVTPLGTSRMALTGGAVVVDGGPHPTRLSIRGQSVGNDAARLQVTQSYEGREVVAASLVARRGTTIILAGGGLAEDDLLLVCLTLL